MKCVIVSENNVKFYTKLVDNEPFSAFVMNVLLFLCTFLFCSFVMYDCYDVLLVLHNDSLNPCTCNSTELLFHRKINNYIHTLEYG